MKVGRCFLNGFIRDSNPLHWEAPKIEKELNTATNGTCQKKTKLNKTKLPQNICGGVESSPCSFPQGFEENYLILTWGVKPASAS